MLKPKNKSYIKKSTFKLQRIVCSDVLSSSDIGNIHNGNIVGNNQLVRTNVSEFQFQPNPFDGVIHVKNSTESDCNTTIIGLTGKIVYKITLVVYGKLLF